MDPQFHCHEANRVRLVRNQASLNGIDFLEIADTNQFQIRVTFIHTLPGLGLVGEVPPGGPALTANNFAIEGGVRVTGIQVIGVQLAGSTALLTVNARGDFSTYTLRLVAAFNDAAPPVGYDPRLSVVKFSFKAACPSDFDCRTPNSIPSPQFDSPALDYLAKDYPSFRNLILDRLSNSLPEWRDRSAADLLGTLVEVLAYTADQLSYWQDAIATEAYLDTARHRVSLRRHARLLDYTIGEGCNARTWVHFHVNPSAEGKILPVRTPIFTAGADSRAVLTDADDFRVALRDTPVVFETLHSIILHEGQNEIPFHTWSDGQCCLPKGATRATLVNQPDTKLTPGAWLLFEEVLNPDTLNPADADPAHRHMIRLTRAEPTVDPLDGTPILEIEWDQADALPFPLCVSVRPEGAVEGTKVSVARGNIVLADHGQTMNLDSLELMPGSSDRPPRATLPLVGLTFAVPFDPLTFEQEGKDTQKPVSERLTSGFLTASEAMQASPSQAFPAVSLELDNEVWSPRRDLFSSDRFAPDFVVELDRDGTVQLRFGDGIYGLRPVDSAKFSGRIRLGNGPSGNLGREALRRVFTTTPGIQSLRNPVPALGGTNAESMEKIRQFAPRAFRRQERAVTEDDWVNAAQRYPQVRRATATFRWTGSWHTVFITIDRQGGLPVTSDPLFVTGLTRYLEGFRLAGYDLEINGPTYVPLALEFHVCVKPGYFKSDVLESLLRRLGTGLQSDGRRSAFDPDQLTFGQAIYLSSLYAEILSVAGVESAEATDFRRFGQLPNGELAKGFIEMGPLEIPRCDNDPNFPENGQINFTFDGGL